jgi:hypothetical protein
MIEINKGDVRIKGTGNTLLAELATLVNTLYNDVLKGDMDISDEEARDLITTAVERGFKTTKELMAEAKAKAVVLEGSLPEVLDQLKAILEDIEGKDDE